MEKTADFFGISVSTVHGYCKGIQVPIEVREQQPSNPPEASNDADHTQEDDHQEPVVRAQVPRLGYEITAQRPQVYGLHNEHNGVSHPAPSMGFSDRDDWDEIVSQVRAAAWSARYQGRACDYYRDKILPDLEIADLAKSYAGTSEPDLVRDTLAIVWKKSLAFDRIQRDTGLSTGKPERHIPSEGLS